MFLPLYRGWVVLASLAVCLATWYVIERTPLGPPCARRPNARSLVQALGINVPVLVTATYGVGVALAAFAGCWRRRSSR